MRRFLAGLFLLASPVAAQQQEQATIFLSIPPIWCDGIHPDGGMIYLENYVDRPLPSPIYILGSWIWIDGVSISATLGNIKGNLPLTVDPQQQYANETGWPISNGSAVTQPLYYKMVAFRQLEAPTNSVYYPLQLPVRYSSGDGIAVSGECTGGTGIKPLQVWSVLNIISPISGADLKDLPVPSTFYESRVALTSQSGVGIGSSVRNIFPGPTQTTTRIRARMHQYQGPNAAQVQHVSVCLQAGNTSSCQSSPVQLKFGNWDYYYLYGSDAVWTNTIPFTVPAGQNVLITVSSFLPGTTNYWSLSATGNGMWYSTTDAWNTIPMTNATFYANLTRTVDWVQMW